MHHLHYPKTTIKITLSAVRSRADNLIQHAGDEAHNQLLNVPVN